MKRMLTNVHVAPVSDWYLRRLCCAVEPSPVARRSRERAQVDLPPSVQLPTLAHLGGHVKEGSGVEVVEAA